MSFLAVPPEKYSEQSHFIDFLKNRGIIRAENEITLNRNRAI